MTMHHLHNISYPLETDDGLGVAKLLLERGADMDARDEDNTIPLHLACSRGRLNIAKVLLEAKAQTENDADVVPPAGHVSFIPPPRAMSHCITPLTRE